MHGVLTELMKLKPLSTTTITALPEPSPPQRKPIINPFSDTKHVGAFSEEETTREERQESSSEEVEEQTQHSKSLANKPDLAFKQPDSDSETESDPDSDDDQPHSIPPAAAAKPIVSKPEIPPKKPISIATSKSKPEKRAGEVDSSSKPSKRMKTEVEGSCVLWQGKGGDTICVRRLAGKG